MAYQSQTYSNNNHGYYVVNQQSINPSSSTALLSPVEFLSNNPARGDYYGVITQDPSTLTFAENETATFSTINAVIMDPTVPVTKMFVSDKTNVADQPIIQQWSNTSTIVNGIFKAGNKNLNDEDNAYYIQNTSQVTYQGIGTQRQTTTSVNNSTRFGNVISDNLFYTQIEQAPGVVGVSVNAPGGYSKITTSSFVIGAGLAPGVEITKLGNAPGSINTVLGSYAGVEIRTSQTTTNLTNATFQLDGTTSFLSTIFAPTVSSVTTNALAMNTSTITGNVALIPDLQNVSTLKSNTSMVNVKFETSGITNFQSTISAPSMYTTDSYASTFIANSGQIENLYGLSTINLLPIQDYIGNPIGTIISWASLDLNLIPPGYLLCDGSYVSQATYPKLYIIIGNAWGGSPPPGFFRLPDCRGKVLAGSMTINSPTPGISNGTPYTVNGICTGLDIVTIPAFLGGGSRICMRVTNLDNQLYIGMRIATGGFDNFIQITQFIDSDGMYGNEYPQGNQPARVNLIMFNSSVGYTNPLPVNITFTNADTDVRLYPFVGQQWVVNQGIRTGIGAHFIVNNSFQTSNHTHVWGQGGASGQSGLGPRCGDPNNPLDTSGTNTLFTYPNKNPAIGGTVNGPSAVDIMPYNIATWQLIKY